MLMSMGSSGTSIYMGCLLAYRNTPHEATGEKPSYLGSYPIEAAFLPANEVEGADLTGYQRDRNSLRYSVNPETPEALQKVL